MAASAACSSSVADLMLYALNQGPYARNALGQSEQDGATVQAAAQAQRSAEQETWARTAAERQAVIAAARFYSERWQLSNQLCATDTITGRNAAATCTLSLLS